MEVVIQGRIQKLGEGGGHGIGKLHETFDCPSFKGGGASPKVSTSSDIPLPLAPPPPPPPPKKEGIATFMHASRSSKPE